MGPTVVSYGGGSNSTALLLGLLDRGRRPDLILFADTGGEKPGTYQYLRMFSSYLQSQGFPGIVRTVVDNHHGNLEQECINNETLPSKAFGNAGCSIKWKVQPQERYIKQWEPAVQAWAREDRVVRLIGIDAGEAHRADKAPLDDPLWQYEHPLIDWDWGREECIEAIHRHGLPMPGKSACWYCPSSKKREVIRLADEYPELFERAREMEANALLTTAKGLGRSYSWGELVDAHRAQGTFDFQEVAVDTSCVCWDGGDEEDD